MQMERLALTKLEAVNKKNVVSGKEAVNSKNIASSGRDAQ